MPVDALNGYSVDGVLGKHQISLLSRPSQDQLVNTQRCPQTPWQHNPVLGILPFQNRVIRR